MLDRIQEATDFLSGQIPFSPRIGFITGTGLSGIVSEMEVQLRIPYSEIPHFPVSTIPGHMGTLAFCRSGEQNIVLMEGRTHLYEGYTPQQIIFPLRVMSRLGAEFLFISSAAGGLNPLFEPGDIMLVTDHLNFAGTNPLVGPNLDSFGPRFPEMSQAYDPALRELAARKALDLGLSLQKGVYVGILGPSLETPAETRFLRLAGADAVGMSTVLEVITAIHCGLRVLAIVAITNVNIPERPEKTSIEDIIQVAARAAKKLAPLFRGVVSDL